MSPHLVTALRPSIRRLSALLILTVLATVSACAPKPATPAPAPTVAPPTPTVSQTCPEPSAGPSIVVQAVEDARRAMAANPTGPMPPACLVTAFVRIPVVVPDSLTEHALGIASELDSRGADRREVLASEIALLSRARRYADVSRAYARLAAIDPQPPFAVMRFAIVAAHQRADTATLLRLVSAAASRADAPPALRTEHTVLQQVGALRSAIDESRGFIRQNPKYAAAYPSLVGNFGTLGKPDSVIVYIGRALRQGVARASLMPAVDPLVNTMLRHASLYGSAYGWETPIAAATRLDSALTTPSTKFLMASLIAQAAEPQIAELGPLIEGSSLFPRAAGSATQPSAPACQRVASLMSSLDVAAARLRDAGERYAGGGASQLAEGIAAERERITALRDACARNP